MQNLEDDLITNNLALVTSIATKIAAQLPVSVEFEELQSFGREGLTQAARRYDPDRGVAFTTYAYYRIRGAILDGLRTMGSSIGGYRLMFEARADAYLEERSADPRPPTAVAAAERLSHLVTDLTHAYLLCSDQAEEAPDRNIPDPHRVAEAKEQMTLISSAIALLPQNEQEIIHLMYVDGLNLTETATRLEISKGWASKLHARALAALRKVGADPPIPPPKAIRV